MLDYQRVSLKTGENDLEMMLNCGFYEELRWFKHI